MNRVFLFFCGLFGAAGVALAAQAAHGGGVFTQTISTMLLVHAPLFVGLGASGAILSNRVLRLAALVLLVSVALFALDLYVRDFGMARLFPLAAPFGGVAMIAGWLGIALSAFALRR